MEEKHKETNFLFLHASTVILRRFFSSSLFFCCVLDLHQKTKTARSKKGNAEVFGGFLSVSGDH